MTNAEPTRTIRTLAGFLLCGIACAGLLAGANALTRERIDSNRAEAANAIARQLADGRPLHGQWRHDQWPLCDGYTLLRTRERGYAGAIDLVAAAARRGDRNVLTSWQVAVHVETPGIGDFIEDAHWRQLALHAPDDPSYVQATTGATITARAITRALERLRAVPLQVDEAPCDV